MYVTYIQFLINILSYLYLLSYGPCFKLFISNFNQSMFILLIIKAGDDLPVDVQFYNPKRYYIIGTIV